MTMDVIFSPQLRLKDIRKKTKQFFLGTEYINRNNIYTYAQAISSYNIGEKTIHITTSQNNQLAKKEIADFICAVFGESLIGIRTSDPTFINCLEKINYYLV